MSTVATPGSSSDLSPADAAILVLKGLEHDARVLKESQTLAAAGLDVVRVGVVTRDSDPEWETTGHDRILRVRTTDKLASAKPAATGAGAGGGSSAGSSAYGGLLGDVRHWLGRHRDNRKLADAVTKLQPRVVIACDLNTLPAGWRIKRETGCHLVYDAHELFTEMSPPRSWLYKALWGMTERRLIRKADVVITVNEQRAREFAKRYGIAKPAVVLNGPLECLGSTGPAAAPVRLIYQGGLTAARGIDMLVRAMKAVRGKAVLSLQGFGADEQRLKDLVEELALADTVHFIDPVPPDQVVTAAHEHDVGVVIYKAQTLNDRLAAPNKLLDYLGGGIAVLGVRLPMIEEIVTREQCGALFEPEDETDLARALQDVVSDAEALDRMKRNAAQACERYAWRSQEATLLSAIGITSTGSAGGHR